MHTHQSFIRTHTAIINSVNVELTSVNQCVKLTLDSKNLKT